MDIFKFINPTHSLKMEQGEIVNGLKSKTWIERYDDAGEFTLIADAKIGIREKLPIGTFISHVDTPEIMIVENHEITDEEGKNSEIIITGRGFETFFDNRIVGSNKTFPVSNGSSEYLLTADYLWNQVVTLLEEHLLASELIDAGNALPYLEISTDIPDGGESVARSLRQGPLYTRLLELLNVGALGVKIYRPGDWHPFFYAVSSENTALVIHVGNDKSDEIAFSHDTGEIVSSQYLWSSKKNKNAALVSGRWVKTTVTPTEEGIERRWMEVDASDIDQNLSAEPAGATLTNIINAMQRRGEEALSAQNEVALTKAEVSKNASRRNIYRRDFFVGDIIAVDGGYNESSSMRISEYVEIEDETGGTSYPTLTVI